MPPLVMGQFNSIGQILGYLPFLQLGIFNGLNRELPYFVGKQEHQRVRDLAAAAQAWALLLGLASGAVLLAIGAWELAHGRVMWAAGWAANAVLAFLLFYSVNYLNMTFRTGHEFARLAVIGVVEMPVGLLLVGLIVVLSWFGMTFYGICLRLAIAGTISAAMLHHWRPVRVAPRWDFFQLKHLLVIGFPIFLVGQLYAWWVPLNNTVVWFCAGDLGLGLYAMVLTANTALEAIPQALGQVLYPADGRTLRPPRATARPHRDGNEADPCNRLRDGGDRAGGLVARGAGDAARRAQVHRRRAGHPLEPVEPDRHQLQPRQFRVHRHATPAELRLGHRAGHGRLRGGRLLLVAGPRRREDAAPGIDRFSQGDAPRSGDVYRDMLVALVLRFAPRGPTRGDGLKTMDGQRKKEGRR